MPKVIIYTCAYNAERTLSRTIESVLNQTYEDFEYYIVDNGSTDATEAIINSYCNADERICKISLLQNDIKHYGTISYALKHICKNFADWITLIDADDTWQENYLETMVRFGYKNQLDIVLGGYEQFDMKSGNLLRHRKIENDLIIERENYAENYITYRGYCLTLWGKLYGLKSKPLDHTYNSSIMTDMYGDAKSVLNSISRSEKIGICSGAVYNWYIHDNSYMKTNFDEFLQKYDSHYYYGKNHLEFLEPDKPISNLNQNFLYAIYLTELQNAVNVVINSSCSQPQKLVYIKKMFCNPLTKETFAYQEINHEIKNMVNRDKILGDIIENIKSMNIENAYKVLFDDIVKIFDSLIEGEYIVVV